MYRKWLLLAGVADLFILSLLDRIAFHYYLYWRLDWFDIFMHLIGGVAIGLVSAYAYWEWQKEKFPHPANSHESNNVVVDRQLFLRLNLGFILVAGLGWEIFEVWVDRITRFDLANVAKDLLFGIVGSLSVGLFVLWIHNHKLKKSK